MTRYDRQREFRQGDIIEIMGKYAYDIIDSEASILKFQKRNSVTWRGRYHEENKRWKGTNGERVFIVHGVGTSQVVPDSAIRLVSKAD